MRLVVDIESDGLLPELTKFHCAGAIDITTGKEYWFRNNQLKEFLALLSQADLVVAHNAFGYDVPALKKLAKLYGLSWDIDPNKVHCTKVMSQVLNYRRFGFGHSLKQWGEFFKDNKGDYNGGWEEFNKDMFEYMKQDVRLGTKVYEYLLGEMTRYVQRTKSKAIGKAIRLEMEMDRIMAEQCQGGWKFNVKGAKDLIKEIDKKMKVIEDFINPKLPGKAKAKDDVPKKPTFTKAGKLNHHIRNWFQLDDDIDVTNCPIWGEFSRVEFSIGDIGNTDTVKRYLYTLGWEPDDWNWKRIDGGFVKVSPKLTDSSLEPLGDVGKALTEYYTLRSRKSIIEGWFDYVDDNSRLHGDVFNIGTPTFRQSHKIIANLPSGKAVLGPEIRRLFVTEKGYKLVSADSAACQLRLLAHFMKDPDFTNEILNGDIHQKNADIIGCTRNEAKRFIFAYLYGAGAPKLSGYINQSVDRTRESIAKYKAALPKLVKLIDTVNHLVESQKFIPGLDDRPIRLDPKERHKALNYLIQGAEAVVMKATVVMIDKRLKEAGIDFKHLLFYHDEHTVEVREDQAEQAREIIISCFEDAPKQYGIDIMTCGDCNIGADYYDVH